MRSLIRIPLLLLGAFLTIGLAAPRAASAGCGPMTCAATHDGDTLRGGTVLEADGDTITKWTCEYGEGEGRTVLTVECREVPTAG